MGREGGSKKILNEKAEPCDQHQICFKQDIYKLYQKKYIYAL